jgi:hypothetical protein
MFWGSILAIVGFAVLLTGPVALIALAGFVLIGLGASNIVPVLFRQAGVQKAMPSSLAVSAISIVGYAGYLTGPAGIGFVAKALNLESAFWLLTGLLCVIPCCAQLVTQRRA